MKKEKGVYEVKEGKSLRMKMIKLVVKNTLESLMFESLTEKQIATKLKSTLKSHFSFKCQVNTPEIDDKGFAHGKIAFNDERVKHKGEIQMLTWAVAPMNVTSKTKK